MHAGVAMLCVLQCEMHWHGSIIGIYVLGRHVTVELPLWCFDWRLLWLEVMYVSVWLHCMENARYDITFVHVELDCIQQ